MSHIVNGDALTEIFKYGNIPGIILPMREILMEGPVRSYTDIENFWEERSHFLYESYGGSREDYLRYQTEMAAQLLESDSSDEIVLWFDTDLFCQVNLIFLIYWLSQEEMGDKKISLICPEGFPGMEDFHGMGELEPEQLSSLVDTRKELSMEDKQLYSEIWKYYCESDPQNLYNQLELLREKNPVLYQAILMHFQRYPSIRNGMNRIEKEIVESIERGNDNFALIFLDYVRNYLFEGYGIGDWQLLIDIQEMGKGNYPILKLNGLEHIRLNPSVQRYEWNKYLIEITEFGKNVMGGREDWIGKNGIHRWLGGVLLSGNQCWRWNEENQKLIFL